MTDLNKILDPLFEATHPDVMGRNAFEATLPIAFLDEVYNATTRADILAAYAKWTKRIMGAESCSISLLNDEGLLELATLSGKAAVKQGATRELQNSTVGAVFNRCQSVFVPKLSEIPHPFAQMAYENGYKCAYLGPIYSNQQTYGVITATFRVQSMRPSLIMTLIETMARFMGTQLMLLDQVIQLENVARTDPLTGTRNRRAFEEETPRSWASWQTDKIPFAFLTLDIDRFKAINDTHGHAVGDSVLQELANRILRASRTDNTVFRLGGEEFGVLLPDTSRDKALGVAERLHHAIRAQPFVVNGIELIVTASFGVTESAPRDLSPDDVINRADEALYHAKRSGRDRIVQAAAHQNFLN